MNPNNSTSPNSLDLPSIVPADKQPLPEASIKGADAHGAGERNPEILTPNPVASAPSSPPVAAGSIPIPAVPTPAGHQASNSPGQTAATPAIADDTDLIEKEWVEKAKEIVNSTKSDPYKQNRELNQMKADYIKKRYSKELQTGE